MIFVEQMNGLLEGLISASLAVILEASSKVVKEIFKFIIILLIVYYFAMWSFQFLEEALKEASTTSNENRKDLNALEDLVAHQIVGETCLRIGPPDENLIKQRASILEQLEIEAEFEENQEKLIKSEADIEQFVKKEIHTAVPKIRESDDIILPTKDHFISQIKQELNETSRASQTLRTSLGKKSKLKEVADNKPTTSKGTDDTQEEDLIRKFETNKIKEILVDQDLTSPRGSGTGKTKRSSKNIKEEEITYFDDQYDHESFHRV